jgi:hypothetical protein
VCSRRAAGPAWARSIARATRSCSAKVAIKVLADLPALDRERLGRFEREALELRLPNGMRATLERGRSEIDKSLPFAS